MAEFIFMLTRRDVTVPEACAIYASLANTGIDSVGCKDVGLPSDELGLLIREIRSRGHRSFLEVVSETMESTLKSARVAAEVRPDYLIGGTLIEPIRDVLADSGIRFF